LFFFMRNPLGKRKTNKKNNIKTVMIQVDKTKTDPLSPPPSLSKVSVFLNQFLRMYAIAYTLRFVGASYPR
jgi:hypothetical protein